MYADAASTGLYVDGSSGGDTADSDVDPSTNTDLEEEVTDNVEDARTLIYLESGQISISSDSQSDIKLGSSASDQTAVGYYIEVDSSIGDILYIPADYTDGSLYVDGSGLIRGCRSSSWYGYIGDYTVRFPCYSDPQYRSTSSSSYTWTDVDITFVDSSNVEVLGANVLPTSSKGSIYLIFSALGVIILAAFMKH